MSDDPYIYDDTDEEWDEAIEACVGAGLVSVHPEPGPDGEPLYDITLKGLTAARAMLAWCNLTIEEMVVENPDSPLEVDSMALAISQLSVLSRIIADMEILEGLDTDDSG